MPGIASSAPAVLLAHLAAATSTIRVGSGGVMLPNHAPLVVAEQFGMLEALHPGPGRPRHRAGPGHRPDHRPGAAAQRAAARRRRVPPAARRALRLLRRVPRRPPAAGRAGRARAWATDPRSGCSGRATTAPRWPACSASPSPSPTTSRRANTGPAVDAYRRRFRPSDDLAEPHLLHRGVGRVRADRRGGPAHRPCRRSRVRPPPRRADPGDSPRPRRRRPTSSPRGRRRCSRAATSGQIVGDPGQRARGPAPAGRGRRAPPS